MSRLNGRNRKSRYIPVTGVLFEFPLIPAFGLFILAVFVAK